MTVNLDGCENVCFFSFFKCVLQGGMFHNVDKPSIEENKQIKRTCFCAQVTFLVSLKSTIYEFKIFIRLVLKGLKKK